VNIDQDRARALGVSTESVSRMLNAALNGEATTAVRGDNDLVQVVLRGPPGESRQIELLGSLSIPTAGGASIPLAQIAKLEYAFEDGILWRRDRSPTVTARADIYADIQPPQVVAMLAPEIAKFEAALPSGYHLQLGGTVEESGKGSGSVNAGVPLMLLVVLTILMLQLRSYALGTMVFLTAPLGMIGVALFLLVFRQPFGFMSMLGTIALFGMIMRNSVILIDQIRQDIEHGRSRYEAVVEATVRRYRPIVLTAAAAVLAMIPLSRSDFFGPMAVAIMGGLIIATVLTLLFLPALYAAWFRVPEPPPAPNP